MTELRVDINPQNSLQNFAMYQAPRGLSATNHRLYRQFRSYNLKVKLTMPIPNGIEVYALKDTWMVRNAIKKACKVYMNTQTMYPGQEEKPARWHDFRIMPTDATGTEISQMLPIGFVTDDPSGPVILGTTSTGQYDYSDIRNQSASSSTLSARFCIGGVSGVHIDILQAYMDQDDTSSDEAGASDAYSEFFVENYSNDSDDEGDLAPYNMTNLDNYLVRIDTLHSGKTTTANFDALLGWVFFRHNTDIRESAPTATTNTAVGGFSVQTDSGTVYNVLQVIHTPGKYKGVKSDPIGKIIKIGTTEYDVK